MNWTFWKRSKRTLATSGLLRDLTDCHSHLLPGVDDGVRSLDESLQILADMESAGIRKVWLTPHIMEDMPNTTERLRERTEQRYHYDKQSARTLRRFIYGYQHNSVRNTSSAEAR